MGESTCSIFYNIEDYEPVKPMELIETGEASPITSKSLPFIPVSPFSKVGKREYHTDISEHLEDLNHLSTPRFDKNKFKNKDKFKKTSNKNWIKWSCNISPDLSRGENLLDLLRNKFRSFWDEIIKNIPQDNIVLLVFRVKTSYGSTRFIHYMKFFPHKPKIFDRVYYLLEKEFKEKTEFIHTSEGEKIISGIVFQYQIIPIQKNLVNEENSKISSKTDSTSINSSTFSINKSSPFKKGGKKEYHTINIKSNKQVWNTKLLDLKLMFFSHIQKIGFLSLLFILLLEYLFGTYFSSIIISPMLLYPIPLNVDSEEFIEINSHTIAEYDDYSDEDEDEEYPSPTPIRSSNGSVNELDLDEEVSPEVIQTIADETDDYIDEHIEEANEILQEELGDDFVIEPIVLLDDENDSSNGPEPDADMLCDMSYIYGFDTALDLEVEELTNFLFFLFNF